MEIDLSHGEYKGPIINIDPDSWRKPDNALVNTKYAMMIGALASEKPRLMGIAGITDDCTPPPKPPVYNYTKWQRFRLKMSYWLFKWSQDIRWDVAVEAAINDTVEHFCGKKEKQ